METNLLEKTKLTGRNNKGQFVKGFVGNPTGNNQFDFLKDLVDALQNESKRQGFENFSDVIAKRALQYETVLIAVLKKVIPDKIEHSGEIKFTEQEKLERLNRIRGLIPNF
uniref:Uncharacterized protein n=1 Tax=viral metagenome TaxID=1070528 RepID=A0A6H1ZWX7_9ZZZZ